MFYALRDELTSVEVDNINDYDLYIGYIGIKELDKVATSLDFNQRIVVDCEREKESFRQIISSYDNYVLATLKVLSNTFALIVSDNLLLVVDFDEGGSAIRDVFMSFMGKLSGDEEYCEKIILLFFDAIFDFDNMVIDKYKNKIKKLENMVESNKTKDNFNLKLLDIKNKLVDMRNRYEYIIDISQFLYDDYNSVFAKKGLKYFKFIEKRAVSFREKIDFIQLNVVHLREAYQGVMELRLNETMKLLTAFTVVLTPLNLITSYFGMNFKNMILINSDYGYFVVALVSIVIFIGLIIAFKHKRLF